jgi:AraC-like DNA-binding protein
MGTEGKVAVITGASQSIGAALAEPYRDCDYRAGANARSILQSGGATVPAAPGEIGKPKTAERTVSEAMARFRWVDTLVNNAGIPFEAAGLLKEVRRMTARDPQGAHSAALRLVSLLTLPENSGGTATRGALAPWQVRKVDHYVRATLDRSTRVADLARQVSLSVSHFSRAFKTSFGTTPRMYIIRLRLELAQTLMLTTRDSLSQIALLCGLADQAHLSKLFRREVGESPSAWRRRNL